MSETALGLSILIQGATAAGVSRRARLARLPACIGRAPDCALRLTDPSVARRHLEIRDRQGAPVAILAAGARARLNGRSLIAAEPVILEAGDLLELGVYALRFDGPQPADPPPAPPRATARALADRLLGQPERRPRRLVVLNGPRAGQTLALESGPSWSLGRGGGCDLVLDDGQVSRQHALVHRVGPLLLVEDAGSQNGLQLNGESVAGRAPLAVGDRLGVGRILLRVEAGPDPQPACSRLFALAARGDLRAGLSAWWFVGLALAAVLAAAFS